MGTFRIFIVALLGLFLVACSSQQTSSPNLDVTDTSQTSLDKFGILKVTGASGIFYGSGFAIDKDLVVTAAHVYAADHNIKFNGMSCELYRYDEITDIAIMRIPDHGFKIFELADAKLLEEVYPVGYIGWHREAWPVFGKGYITSLNISNMIYCNGSVQPGMSGGPLLNSNFRVIGVTSGCITWSEQGFGQLVPNPTMAAFSPSVNIKILLSDTPYSKGV